ncbi:hypothetical protein GCM10009118_29730 [Wandonia haliotis]|uniref:Lipoprotein n=1 Tax=Wandonia haliotis TaxID=574963 RepID=A0ABN1MT87_9FLAO
MKKVYFVVSLVLVSTFMSCGSESSSSMYSNEEVSYQETKVTLEDQEKTSPLRFLTDDGTYRKNLLGEWVLEGSILNSAKIATYKDVVLEVRYYSKTNTLLGTERHTIYEFFPAGSSKRYKIKTNGFKGTKKLGWDIISASNN